MSIDYVKDRLRDLALAPENDTIVLRGRWGVGKTYYWQKLIQSIQENKTLLRRHIYVSLFGINEIATLKSLVTAQYLLKPTVDPAKGGANLLRLFKRETVKPTLDFAKQIPYLRHLPFGLAGTVAFLSVKDSIICIDDLERKGDALRMTEILGFAAELKEQRNCKIVFILNSDTLEPTEKEIFDKYNEKLVDWEFEFIPTTDDIIDFVFSPQSADYELIRSSCRILQIRNIRVLKRIRSFIDLVDPYLLEVKDDELREGALKSLILFTWCNFDHEGTRIPLDFLRHFSSYVIRGETADRGPVDTDPYYEILGEYSYVRTDDLDRELIEIVQRGFVKGDDFISVLRDQHDRFTRARDRESYSDAWRLYRNTFGNNEKEFVRTLHESCLNSLRILQISEIDEAVVTLRELGYNDLANDVVEKYVEKSITLEKLVSIDYPEGVVQEPKDEYLKTKINVVFTSRPDESISFDDLMKDLENSHARFGPSLIDNLGRYSTEQFYEYFMNYSGEHLHKVVATCLRYDKTKRQVTQALKRIRNNSPLDRMRVENLYPRRYLDIPDETSE